MNFYQKELKFVVIYTSLSGGFETHELTRILSNQHLCKFFHKNLRLFIQLFFLVLTLYLHFEKFKQEFLSGILTRNYDKILEVTFDCVHLRVNLGFKLPM